ncbi:MAG: YraN family protein [Ruminococcaceae bacterium]|nr:YraN family protein [Oscillospiraceae bacterium]
MMDNKKKGKIGEIISACYLFLKGYEILERNYFIKGGEIDIVAKKRDTIIMVEVKTRTDKSYGEAKEAVNYYKQKHLGLAAKCFLKYRKTENMKVRFDVIEVYLKPFRINHIKHAFEIS